MTKQELLCSICRTETLEVTLLNGDVYHGSVERIEDDFFILDDDAAFGDMIVIYYNKVAEIK